MLKVRIFENRDSRTIFLWAFLISVIFSTIYSGISLLKFFDYRSTVFDLGVNGAQIYLVFHGGIPLTLDGLKNIAYNKLIYLLMSPFYAIYPKMWTLLVFQDTLLSFSALPLGMIAWKRTNSKLFAFAIPILWNFYFPVEGIFWFDFHFMALFPFFFLTGIMLGMYNKRRSSIVFLVLASITDYLAPFIVFAYIVVDYLQARRDNSPHLKHNKKLLLYFSVLLIFVFVSVNIATSFNYTYAFTSNFFPSSSTGPGFISDKITFIIWIFAPFLFLPFIAPLELLIAIPGIGLALFNNYPGFFMQGVQYPALFAPGIFFAFISAMSLLLNHLNTIRIPRLKMIIPSKAVTRTIIAFVVVSIVLTGISIGPYAAFEKTPLQVDIQNMYPIYGESQYTFSPVQHRYISYLNSEISLIPKNQTVLIQNNMPCLAQDYRSMVPGIISNGTIPEYIIAYPYTSWFDRNILPSMGKNATPLYTIDNFLLSHNYGIIEEKAGITLYRLNTASTTQFIPYDQNLSFKDFPSNKSLMGSNGEIFFPSHSNGTLIYGPYFMMPQGKFNLTFHLSGVQVSNGGSLSVQAFTVSNYMGKQQYIGEGSFNVSVSHNQMNLTINLVSPYYFNNIQYDLVAGNLTGTFTLDSVTLVQTSE